MNEGELLLYAIGWALGAALLAFLMKLGRLPSAKSTTPLRVAVAVVVALLITAAVYGARRLDERAQRLRQRRHQASRTRISTKKAAPAAGAPARSDADDRSPANTPAPSPAAAPPAAPPAPRSPPRRRTILDTLRDGTRNAAALLKRAGAERAGEPQNSAPDEAAEEPQTAPPAAIEIDTAPTEADLDLEFDREQSLRTAGSGMVGEARQDAFAARVRPRRQEAADRWLGGSAKKLADILTFEGMRSFADSTLYAREGYKTHQWHEPGEGMDQRYVDPSLMSYDPAFAAYGDRPFIHQRSTLSTNAPAAF